ncbi:MAG: exodeoxyribonuclease VII large subunit [Syntrophales bacterium]|jgi:exodeoxyribonuclease VII large subunit|nr:exodeoxyribonuclease VII large subunit [Syntrophales bacterium]MCK9527689.1 exodeoxyribonuclease VII large subunit [Syntrophales bacterium]MDX9921656.1 exodeoxyribonuclease VII large subunit [Syntrophales bacterium]
MNRIFTVSELTAGIKALVETGFGVLWVAGEVSNLRRPGSGHVYFTLKDESSQIRAVMFRQNAAALNFTLEEGSALVCRGRLSVYAARGDYQLVVETAEPRGVGALQIAFEQLKRRLEEEGLFDQGRKRSLPRFPARVGIVTSPAGAVIRDILTVMKRRWPSCDVLLAPVRVQGAEAVPEICEALEIMNGPGIGETLDLIIVARGGGSIEDLQAFNDERVARAIHGSRLPVVSAVGHEIDYTIADFTADLRAPTPSAAAELVVPDRRELAGVVTKMTSGLVSYHRSRRQDLWRRLNSVRERLADPGRRITDYRILLDDRLATLEGAFRRTLEKGEYRTEMLARSLRNLSPSSRIDENRRMVGYLMNKILLTMEYRRGRIRGRVDRSLAVLDSMSPPAVLKRGYSITRRRSDGALLDDVSVLRIGEDVTVRVARGSFHARVTEIMEEVPDGGKEI